MTMYGVWPVPPENSPEMSRSSSRERLMIRPLDVCRAYFIGGRPREEDDDTDDIVFFGGLGGRFFVMIYIYYGVYIYDLIDDQFFILLREEFLNLQACMHEEEKEGIKKRTKRN